MYTYIYVCVYIYIYIYNMQYTNCTIRRGSALGPKPAARRRRSRYRSLVRSTWAAGVSFCGCFYVYISIFSY